MDTKLADDTTEAQEATEAQEPEQAQATEDLAGAAAQEEADEPEKTGQTDPAPATPPIARGTVAVISKGHEKIPVQVRDGAHVAELIETHGAENVEVQS